MKSQRPNSSGFGPRAPKFSTNIESISVQRQSSGKSLQDFLSERFGLSRRAAKAVIDGRNVWVNRRCVWIAHHSLATGDLVELPRAVVAAARRQVGSARAVVEPEERTHVRVLAETPHYVVADKPAGVLANADAKSVEAILRVQLNEPNLQAVHRLDRDTTGCLLLARSFVAYQAAVEVFKTRRVEKTYRAIVAGAFPYAHQKIDAPIDDQPAVSFVSREAVGEDASFLRVRIETGRTNQIRRHLASVRYPIVGDRTFGLKHARDPRLMTVPRQMLHAASISLPDPMRSGETVKAHSPLPADFRSALRLFGMGKKR
jgi:23S rRNA pseudouridine1911/1915/1917 synthase